ncbi:MAG: GNVR domain-containing protein [Candidatus Limnocylindrales bacterium]
MELSGYLAILRRWWWTLLVAVWVASLLGFLIGSRIAPTWESSVRLLVGPINTDTNTLKASGQLVQTYAELAVSQPLLQSTASELGLPPEAADELAATVRTSANDQTRILTIRVQGPDAAGTTQAANSIAGELIDLTSRGTSLPEGQVQVIEFAKVPTEPIAPQISLIILMAAAAGLIGALVLVLLAEYLADRVQDAEILARLTGEPELGVVPAGTPAPLVGQRHGLRSVPVDTYASIVAALSFADPDTTRRDLVVATADDGTHGTDLALGFAVATAAWRPVILIDADPAGTATLLAGGRATVVQTDTVARRLVPTAVDGLLLLPAGAVPDLADLSPEAARSLLEQVRTGDELVVIDAGNLVGASRGMVWAGVAGEAIIAVRRGSTRRADLREALLRLQRVRAQLLGCVLVESRTARSGRRRGALRPPVTGSDAAVGLVEPSVRMAAPPARARRPRPDEG